MTKKIKFSETFLLIILIFLYFFSISSAVPKYITTTVLVISSLYFFPVKLLLHKGKYTLINLLSDFILSVGLSLLVVGLYLEHKTVFSVFGLLNFVFMVYLALHSKDFEKSKYYHFITNHFLLMFLLAMIF